MDWSTLINDLIESGMSQAEISQETGIPNSTISELRSGKTKKVFWDRGESLVQLHSKRLAKA